MDRFPSEQIATDQQGMIAALQKCKRVLLTTHVRPDGDAMGTLAALILGLKSKGIEAEALLLSRIPPKYAYVFEENGIGHHLSDPDWPAGLVLDRFDAVLVADTGTWSQLPGLRERLTQFGKPLLVLDHHQTQEDWAQVKLVDTAAPAAAEVVAGLLRAWGVTITHPMAEAIYLGLVADTGWFQYSSTRPATMRLAADLMEIGVDTDQLQQRMYQSEPAHRILLQTRIQDSLRLLAEGRLAVMHCRKADFERCGAHLSDTESVINVPMQIASVQVSVLLVEQPPVAGKPPGPIRVSLRSKGGVDVSKVAERFGGGGHARASGLKISASLEEAERQVAEAIIMYLPE
jgi:phosphoesterase RecJ-like protein